MLFHHTFLAVSCSSGDSCLSPIMITPLGLNFQEYRWHGRVIITFLLICISLLDINKVARTATANNNKRNGLAEDLQWEMFQWNLTHTPSFARRLDTSEGVNFISHTSDICAHWTGHDGHGRNGKTGNYCRNSMTVTKRRKNGQPSAKNSITQSIQPDMRDATSENNAAIRTKQRMLELSLSISIFKENTYKFTYLRTTARLMREQLVEWCWNWSVSTSNVNVFPTLIFIISGPSKLGWRLSKDDHVSWCDARSAELVAE